MEMNVYRDYIRTPVSSLEIWIHEHMRYALEIRAPTFTRYHLVSSLPLQWAWAVSCWQITFASYRWGFFRFTYITYEKYWNSFPRCYWLSFSRYMNWKAEFSSSFEGTYFLISWAVVRSPERSWLKLFRLMFTIPRFLNSSRIFKKYFLPLMPRKSSSS